MFGYCQAQFDDNGEVVAFHFYRRVTVLCNDGHYEEDMVYSHSMLPEGTEYCEEYVDANKEVVSLGRNPFE